MTDRRVSRVALESVANDPSPARRVSRVALEFVARDTTPNRRVSRVALESVVSLVVTKELEGAAYGEGYVSAALTGGGGTQELAGTTTGEGYVSGDLLASLELEGSSFGDSYTSGYLTVVMSGSSFGEGYTSVQLTVITEIDGASEGGSYTTASLDAAYELVGTATGEAYVARARPEIPLTGRSEGEGYTFANGGALQARVDGEAYVSAHLTSDPVRLSQLSVEIPNRAAEPGTSLSRLSVEIPTRDATPGLRLSRISTEVPHRTAVPGSRLSRMSLEVLVTNTIDLLVYSFGEGYLLGDLEAIGPDFKQQQIIGTSYMSGSIAGYFSSVGRTKIVLASLDNGFSELVADVRGEGYVLGTPNVVDDSLPPYAPLNYPLGHGSDLISYLAASLTGAANPHAEVTSLLDIQSSAFLTEGDSYTTGSLEAIDPLGYSAVGIEGGSYVIGHLYTTGTVEVAGTTTGDSYVRHIGEPTNPTYSLEGFGRHYYFYGNVTGGFDPTDDLGFDQTFADGDIVRDFPRYKYQYVNVNVGFDYTDDSSGDPDFVSQSYPDGDIVRDFARYKYQYVNVVTPADDPDCRLTIGPAPRMTQDLMPKARPPRREGRP